jgi:hypothetical protein
MMGCLPILFLIAVVALLVMITGLDYPLRRIWTFQRRRFRFEALRGRSQLLARLGRPIHYQVDLSEIRDFVINLQLGTSMDQGLGAALTQTARQFEGRGLFGERLQTHVETRLSIAPEEVFEGLAADFPSPHLQNLPERIETARNGGFSYERALSVTISEVEREIRGNVRRDIQQAPIRLTFPMIAGVFLTAVLIGLYPVVRSVLGTLSGGGLF